MNCFYPLLYAHIVAGTISLIVGTFIIFFKKGNALHRLLGKIYYPGMLASGSFALVLAIVHPNHFLLALAVFTLYMLVTGKRYLKQRIGKTVHLFDWFLALLMAFFSFLLFFHGVKLLLEEQTFGIVLIVFGFISAMFVLSDVQNYRGKSKFQNFGLLTHIQRMTGSYIASVTAFLVVNNTYFSGIFIWLFPSCVLVPFIFIWSKRKAKLMSSALHKTP